MSKIIYFVLFFQKYWILEEELLIIDIFLTISIFEPLSLFKLAQLAPNFSVSYPGNKPANDLLSLFLASVCNDIAKSTCGITLQHVSHIQALKE